MLHLDRLCYQLNEFSLTADLQIAAGDRVAVPRAGQMFWGGQPMPDHPGERPLSILFQDHNSSEGTGCSGAGSGGTGGQGNGLSA